MKNVPARTNLNKPQAIRLISVFAFAAVVGAAIVFAFDQLRQRKQ